MKKILLIALAAIGTASASETCVVDAMAIANNDAAVISCTKKADETAVKFSSDMDLGTNPQFHIKVIQEMKSIGYSLQAVSSQTFYFTKP